MTVTKEQMQSRRRFMVRAGAFGAVSALLVGAGSDAVALEPVKWMGSALGAEASIVLYHSDPVWARRQLARCQMEINRLENLFSLYRPDSALCRLNRDGYLNNPDITFVDLLSQAIGFSQQTNGLFDVTVQPLWQLYAAHFSDPAADPNGPDSAEISSVLERIGSDHILLSSERIAFDRRAMAVTLNGIAQGFITDRITALLRAAGFENVLVSLGESFALGAKPDGSDWRAGIVSPVDGKTIVKTIDLKDKALATSGGYGSPFSGRSDANHLLNPRSGKSAPLHRSVSVVANKAVRADMVSTVLSLMDEEAGRKMIAGIGGIEQVFYC